MKKQIKPFSLVIKNNQRLTLKSQESYLLYTKTTKGYYIKTTHSLFLVHKTTAIWHIVITFNILLFMINLNKFFNVIILTKIRITYNLL